MKSDIQVTVSCPDNAKLNKLRPIGVSISYGVNELPRATLDLSTEDMSLFCDYNEWKRKPLKLIIFTKNGCLSFDGVADGLSTSCSVGSMSTQLVIKHSFQTLLETFPRSPEFHGGFGNALLFSRVSGFTPGKSGQSQLFSLYPSDTGVSLVPFDESNPIKLIKKIAIYMLECQKGRSAALSSTVDTTLNQERTLLNLWTEAKFKSALDLVKSIDTSYTDNMSYNNQYASNMANNMVLPQLVESTGSVLEMLLSAFSLFQCNLVLGVSKAYTVPDAGFLLQGGDNREIKLGERSLEPNIAFPADYSSYQFSDNGYKDIKAVYVSSTEIGGCFKSFTTGTGLFHDPSANVQGGIVVASIPQFSLYAFDDRQSTTVVPSPVSPPTGEKVTPDNAQQVVKTDGDNSQIYGTAAKDFFNNWAQAKYFELKYKDRTGSLNSTFNPRWAPGAVGRIYTRQPGAFIDMFVSNVTHSFSTITPDSGTASTSVAFNCGRFGKVSSGLDMFNLYKFKAENSLAYAKSFVNDVTI